MDGFIGLLYLWHWFLENKDFKGELMEPVQKSFIQVVALQQTQRLKHFEIASIQKHSLIGAILFCLVLISAALEDWLYPEKGLSLAAKDHVLDTRKTGRVGHTSSDGSTMGGRLNRYGKWAGSAGENISYGNDKARDIVVQLLIDDGVSSRRHRANNMSRTFTRIDVAVGKHTGYGSVCVLDFAGTYTGN
jgi:hypothetical protein